MTDEGDFLDIPLPLLNDPEKLISFISWKARFEFTVTAKSPSLWKIIEFGDYIPQKVSPDGNGVVVKPESEWSEEDKTKVHENHLAIHMLYCTLYDSTLQLVYRCDTAHDIWETLALIYEGNSQLKDCKIKLLTQEFEDFQMLAGESIHEMDGRLMGIVSSLRTLGKTLTDEICVERVLGALTPEWNDLVTKVSANKNAYAPSLSALIGNLYVLRSLETC